jgi:hypothetical protein
MNENTSPTLVGTITARANVYFDGRCVSHGIQLADGTHKSVGVITVGPLTFKTGAPETMELVAGSCRVRLADELGNTKDNDWRTYNAGQSFSVRGNSGFDIDVTSTLHYICHFG